MEATIEVANPHYQAGHPEEIATVRVKRALRDDPLGRLHARRQIGDAEYRAGRDMQRLIELAEMGRIGAIDPTSEPVDGGRRASTGITDEQLEAHRQLAQLYPILGKLASAMMRAVLADGLMPEEYGRRLGITDDREINSLGREFRRHLALLAREFGYA